MSPPFTHASWIWTEGDPAPENFYLAARRSFDLAEVPAEALLHLTADSRYLLFVNGTRLGQGPVRCWPFRQRYDTWDLRPHLRAGRNVLSVLVHSFGLSTFQYILGRGGLLAQLDLTAPDGTRTHLGTDPSWRVAPHQAYQRPTPRISCQMAWAEQYDARREPPGWTEPGGDDSAWAPATVCGPPGMEPWTELLPRDIPLLSEEPVYPARVLGARLVKPPDLVRYFLLRRYVLPGDLSAKDLHASVLVALTVHVPAACTAELLNLGDFGGARAATLNGHPVEFESGRAAISLRAGDNLLLCDVTNWRLDWSYALGINCEQPVTFRAPVTRDPQSEADVAIFARYEDYPSMDGIHFPDCDSPALAAALQAATPEELAAAPVDFHAILPEDTVPVRVSSLVDQARAVEAEGRPLAPRVENLSALCAGNPEATILYPDERGDAELLIDFDRELSGYWQLDLEAPEGSIVDLYGFEAFWQGRPQWASVDNSLRYVCREGDQTFHSHQRRGFRYMLLTVRNLTRPLRLREVRCLTSTGVQAHRGVFRCSDERLNRIWEMCAWTTVCCSEDTFVDCPLFEQTFWVGDARNEALINYACFGDYGFVERGWRLVADSLRRSNLPESQVPSGWQIILTAWAELWLIGCVEAYHYSGNLAFSQEIAPAVRATLEEFLRLRNDLGLIDFRAWNLLDWAPMDTPYEGAITHNNAWLVRCLRAGAELEERLGHPEAAARYRAEAAALAESLNRHLWSEERQAYVDRMRPDGTLSDVVSQQTNTVVYLCDCVPPERLELVERYVLEVPPDWTQIGSPFMMFFSLEAMVKLGRFDAILDWTRRWWGMMLDAGATTCWETFPGPGRHTRSHCHAWSAGPAYFLSACTLGVRPLEPGFRRALIAPEPADLTWAQGRYPTPEGEVAVSWERSEGSFRLAAELPEGVGARVVLPVDAAEWTPPPGAYEESGRWVIDLPPGATAALETASR